MKIHAKTLSIVAIILLSAALPQKSTAQTPPPDAATGGREWLLMDFGWRFAFGNATDSTKDFDPDPAGTAFSYFAKAGTAAFGIFTGMMAFALSPMSATKNIWTAALMFVIASMAGVACAQTLMDIGTASPTPGPNDILQLNTAGDAVFVDGHQCGQNAASILSHQSRAAVALKFIKPL
jgi:hypothetical protein